MVSLENLGRSPPAEKHIRIVLAMKGSRISSHPQVRGVRRTPGLGHAVNQIAEVQSALEFFATAHLFPDGFQAYKNEVYLLPSELDEASQRTHREQSSNEVVGKVPVRSCREFYQKSAEHQFVDRQ